MQQTATYEPVDSPVESRIESILLVAAGPVSISDLTSALGASQGLVVQALGVLGESLQGGIRLQVLDGAAQLVTAPENIETVHRFLGTVKPPPLSRSALETLTVIAYHQPTTRSEVERARGVNSDRAVQTLLARGLIEERGQRNTIGRPMEYGTGFGFLEYFGLRSLDDLPPIDETQAREVDARSIGMRARASDEQEKAPGSEPGAGEIR